jgi:hypothetical protein
VFERPVRIKLESPVANRGVSKRIKLIGPDIFSRFYLVFDIDRHVRYFGVAVVKDAESRKTQNKH